ncbi:MAG: hypothetical protein M3068_00185 [Gemmatimonadota bacterium]|nr:hypothetical protein [Gemmatimonadota bacterium]
MPETSRDIFRDAIRYWELRRIGYNLALAGLATGWVVVTWPHFRPSLTLPSLLKLLVLAALANLCYCAAYLVDIPAQQSGSRDSWRRRRWILWLAGTLLALLFAHYWIGDEIYPFPNG